ncbi:peptide chain release factor 2 [Candidatus Purcelliella pentastirinorum]|uniref:Peptide chain release factor 2 n=1 Tax=Candidatus Purcelliella pentastirinorum TaxID=472834 RepID=A0AAX3N8L4_9ENTR|nr:peptide chain release factor 2 [Candidatus Purcelliella pentastirinorum]WDI78728.1 peptide chain release factor 2 [Candidatus Purcelliella pentastirinorum]
MQIKINTIIDCMKNLNKKYKNLRRYFNYKKNKVNFITMKNKLQKIYLSKQNKDIKKINKKYKTLKKTINNIKSIKKKIKYVKELFQLSIEIRDNSILDDINVYIKNINIRINNLKTKKMFCKKYDKYNCYIDFQSGSGGIEAQDWTSILLKMYLKWIEKKKFKSKIINKLNGEKSGIKSATLHVTGKYAFGWLRTESGVHRLVRKSPFDTGNKRHTSFSSTFIYPEIQNKINIKINQNDLRIDVYKSSGSGGQHVNKTESAVRITHISTGIVVQCQNNRSQHKNKNTAMKQIKKKLYNLEIEKKNIKKQKIENKKSDIRWSNQIRSYIFDDSRIKDLRTGIEIRNVQYVLNGNLDKFIKANLNMKP